MNNKKLHPFTLEFAKKIKTNSYLDDDNYDKLINNFYSLTPYEQINIIKELAHNEKCSKIITNVILNASNQKIELKQKQVLIANTNERVKESLKEEYSVNKIQNQDSSNDEALVTRTLAEIVSSLF